VTRCKKNLYTYGRQRSDYESKEGRKIKGIKGKAFPLQAYGTQRVLGG
jgi:hypothetical protein